MTAPSGTAENFAAGPGAYAVAAGDFNGDGWLDVATANASGNSVSVLINDQSWAARRRRLVSVSDATVTEGNTGTVNATFTRDPLVRLRRGRDGPLRTRRTSPPRPAATTRPRPGT